MKRLVQAPGLARVPCEMDEPILLVPHKPHRRWSRRLLLAFGFLACFAGGWIARMQYGEAKLAASLLSPNPGTQVTFRPLPPRIAGTAVPAQQDAGRRPERVTILLTQSIWRDSEGDSMAYKFGPLNEEMSWAEDRNPFRHPEQMLVNSLYTDSDGEIWRYVGGPTRKAESWERAQ